MVYPTGLRGTSIGAAMGFGRLGAILGPIIGGLMIGWNWSIGQMFIAAGIVLVAAAAGSALADRWLRTQSHTQKTRASPLTKDGYEASSRWSSRARDRRFCRRTFRPAAGGGYWRRRDKNRAAQGASGAPKRGKKTG